MKKKLLILMAALVLSVGIWGFTDRTTVCAGCGCAMMCNNTCEANCSNCGSVGECWQKAADCCLAAAKATGDTGPCPVGGGES